MFTPRRPLRTGGRACVLTLLRTISETNFGRRKKWCWRGHPRVRQPSGGRAHELSGLEATADIECNVLRAAKLLTRPPDENLKHDSAAVAVELLDHSAAQVC